MTRKPGCRGVAEELRSHLEMCLVSHAESHSASKAKSALDFTSPRAAPSGFLATQYGGSIALPSSMERARPFPGFPRPSIKPSIKTPLYAENLESSMVPSEFSLAVSYTKEQKKHGALNLRRFDTVQERSPYIQK
ncbi:MAG: hypothetical protein M1813_002230 [Trichoglossum hirsutum]|nr:MAG: hypothetical protein M1813_002230 [Trichoglossum hirsutum]